MGDPKYGNARNTVLTRNTIYQCFPTFKTLIFISE